MQTDVLIVGAGPTGLMLAGWLARAGVEALVIDKKSGPTVETRALGVQARTLETYDQLGLGERALTLGLPAVAVNMWLHGRHVARAPFAEIGKGVSPHPYMFILSQDRNEQLLLEHLEAHGGSVSWETGLAGLDARPEGSTATLRAKDGRTHTVSARYVCGCDGASSPVRHALGIGFPGGTYQHRFYVADVTAEGEIREGELNLCLQDRRFAAFFPMPGARHFRIVGLATDEQEHAEGLGFESVRPALEANFGVTITSCTWFSTYRVHHRVADHFQLEGAFLLGDAAHVHSPAGGQGMNTGLMDAANLAWKLAAVVKGEAQQRLLTSYAAERMPFARTLVATTDRVFGAVVDDSAWGWAVRTLLLPSIFPLASSLPGLAREVFGVISQTRVNYRHGPISRGGAGGVMAGDRLPWVPYPDGTSNFDALRSLKLQLHVYGAPAPASKLFESVSLPFTAKAAEVGLREGAAYLVRPDGYVGYAAATPELGPLEAYVREVLTLHTFQAPAHQATPASAPHTPTPKNDAPPDLNEP